jgi:hypothetical protein
VFAADVLAAGALSGNGRARGLPIAMGGVGTIAAIALIVNGNAIAYLVEDGLLWHAAWGVYHHWDNKIMVRSMAELRVLRVYHPSIACHQRHPSS